MENIFTTISVYLVTYIWGTNQKFIIIFRKFAHSIVRFAYTAASKLNYTCDLQNIEDKKQILKHYTHNNINYGQYLNGLSYLTGIIYYKIKKNG